MAMERLENLSDEVTEGRSSVRVEEERVTRLLDSEENLERVDCFSSRSNFSMCCVAESTVAQAPRLIKQMMSIIS